MTATSSRDENPDFSQGVPLDSLSDGAMIAGHLGEEPILLVRRGDDLFAVAALCPHYHAPLADGLLVGNTIRCPMHHAAFDLCTGALLRPPALDDLKCWRVERRDGRAFVGPALPALQPLVLTEPGLPESVVIVGGGAAGLVAADALRREGYTGPVTMVGADPALPYDRPNLSKDYLAGTAPADWLPLRDPSYYPEHKIETRSDTRVSAIDPAHKTVTLADGSRLAYGALLLATGADPVRLNVPGADAAHVAVVRSLADCDALIARCATAKRCVIVGDSFIGLEVAASLRARGLAVDVIARDAGPPMTRILGEALGKMVQTLHEAHGVVFHFDATLAEIAPDHVKLSTGETLPADLVVAGIGARPDIQLAQQAGLTVNGGVVVDAYLQTSAPGIYAAGDIAAWPDPRTGAPVRVEHWVVAERQGMTAARNMLGKRERFDAVPFFWSQHYETVINYVGHATQWERAEVDGDPAAHDCAVTYWQNGVRAAVATVGRDLESLRAELMLEQMGE